MYAAGLRHASAVVLPLHAVIVPGEHLLTAVLVALREGWVILLDTEGKDSLGGVVKRVWVHGCSGLDSINAVLIGLIIANKANINKDYRPLANSHTSTMAMYEPPITSALNSVGFLLQPSNPYELLSPLKVFKHTDDEDFVIPLEAGKARTILPVLIQLHVYEEKPAVPPHALDGLDFKGSDETVCLDSYGVLYF